MGLKLSELPYKSRRLLKLPNPYIPEADRLAGIAVRLKLDGRGIVLLVKRRANISRLALQLKVILHQHAIEKDCDIGWSLQRAVGIEGWSHPHYIVALPFTGLTIRVHQRSVL